MRPWLRACVGRVAVVILRRVADRGGVLTCSIIVAWLRPPEKRYPRIENPCWGSQDWLEETDGQVLDCSGSRSGKLLLAAFNVAANLTGAPVVNASELEDCDEHRGFVLRPKAARITALT